MKNEALITALFLVGCASSDLTIPPPAPALNAFDACDYGCMKERERCAVDFEIPYEFCEDEWAECYDGCIKEHRDW